MGKTIRKSPKNTIENSQVAEALASAMSVPTKPKQPEQNLQKDLTDFFNGVDRQYSMFGIDAKIQMYHPKQEGKKPYLMVFVQDFVRNHAIGEELNALLGNRSESAIVSLEDLRKHPDVVEWWAPNETAYNAKAALAYFFHGQKEFIHAAKFWWSEQGKKQAEAEENARKERSKSKIETLRIDAIKRQLRIDFQPLNSENALKFTRYTPGMKIAIFDEGGNALYVSTDVQKIYVENIDPEHPLAKLEVVGVFINRAALKSKDEDPAHYADMEDGNVAKKAYLLREYLRNHPLIAEALKPKTVDAIETPDGQPDKSEGVNLGKPLVCEESANS